MLEQGIQPLFGVLLQCSPRFSTEYIRERSFGNCLDSKPSTYFVLNPQIRLQLFFLDIYTKSRTYSSSLTGLQIARFQITSPSKAGRYVEVFQPAIVSPSTSDCQISVRPPPVLKPQLGDVRKQQIHYVTSDVCVCYVQ